jgi:hypothetical protein
VAPAKDKTRHREPLDQMLALEPSFEFRLAPGTAIVEDREYSGLGRHFAATTMISTL